MKIHPVGTKLFHADGQKARCTDMMKLIAAFCGFVIACRNHEVEMNSDCCFNRCVLKYGVLKGIL
jgi:hypothetical protein